VKYDKLVPLGACTEHKLERHKSS